MRQLLTIITLLLLTTDVSARSIPTIPAEQARHEARQQVVWQGRVCTLNTVARHFTQTIYGQPSYKGLSAEQVVYGWFTRPDVWKDEPMILIHDKQLRKQLGIEGDYASFAQLFDDTLGYKLTSLNKDLPEHIQKLVNDAPAVQELDEKAGLIILLTQGKLLVKRPDDMKPMKDWEVELEILYNRLPVTALVLVLIAVVMIVVFRKFTF